MCDAEIRRASISVIVPVYNGERFLAAAVESIQRQSPAPDEIIVVDDGSTDATAAVASRLAGNVRWVHQRNGGPPAARNAGLEVARGEIIGMLDADDLWPDERLGSLLTLLDHDRSIDIVLGRMQLIRGEEPPRRQQFVTLAEPFYGLSLGAALFRRSVFERVGAFDPSLRFSEDLDWFLRALEQRVEIAASDTLALHYRMHTGNITHDGAAVQRGVAAALKKSLDRRRAVGGGEPAPLPPIPGCGTLDAALRQAISLQRTAWAVTD